MTLRNFAPSLALVLDVEGGYSNRPDDAGGPTNHGVTLRQWSAWLGREATIEELQALTPQSPQLAAFYHTTFWNAVRGDAQLAGVDMFMFDSAVHSGPRRAIGWLQTACGFSGADCDGLLGPKTLSASYNEGAVILIMRMQAAREAFLRAQPTFPQNLGWIPRVVRVAKAARDLAVAPSK
jgi:lysozyme family protein